MFKRQHCCVYGCQKTKESNPECTFNPLPKDTARRDEWLKVIGRSELINQGNLNPNSFYVCSSHFENEDMKLTSVALHDAIPSRYLPEPETSSYIDTQVDTFKQPFNHGKVTPALTSRCQKNKDTSPNNCMPVELKDDLTTNMHKLMKEQALLYKDRNSKNFLFYALNLYLLNPQTYRFIRDALNLPSEKVIRKMKLKLSPSLDTVLYLLSSKLKSLPDKAKYCTICIETVNVKNHVYYDILNDELVGLQEIDGIRKSDVASMVYVVMLRSILVKWDQPVTYCALSNANNVAQLEAWIDRIIKRLFHIGFEVMALVTNQESGLKRRATKTQQEHYFVVNNKKIYLIFEFSQSLNYIGDYLCLQDIIYNEKRVSWQYIESLFRIESNKLHKFIPNVISEHVTYCNKMKMTPVQYAAEIFSKSVSRAINAYVDIKKMPEEARDTADFCLLLNNLCDVLNSNSYKSDNIYKCALGTNEAQMKLLQEALNVFNTTQWKAVEHKNEDPKIFNRKFVEAFPMVHVTLNSVISIAQDLNTRGYKLLLTEKLNMEPLKKFINIVTPITSRNIVKHKPTTIQCSKTFSNYFLKCILSKSSLSNRSNAFQKYFEDATRLDTYEFNDISNKSLILLGRGETDYRIRLPAEHPAIYIASYIFYKCHKFHRCDMIDNYASTLPDLANAQVYNAYNRKAPFYANLKLLNYQFVRYIEQLELAFTQVFNKGFGSNPDHPGSQAFINLTTIPFLNSPCKCFPTTYAVKLLIRLRIYSTIKAYNRRIQKIMT